MAKPAAKVQKSLAQKLGIKPGFCVLVAGAPVDYCALVGELPEGVRVLSEPRPGVDIVHLFAADAAALAHLLPVFRATVRPDGAIWVSWPKKAARIPTDLSDVAVRGLVLPTGLVDIKVCAVDATWSGLKFVARRSARG